MTLALSESQQSAWNVLQNNGNVFLTGEAGSGKSFIIKQFMKNRDLKKFPVLASTGAAAVLIGGRTFHSFMGLGILEGGVDATVARALLDRRLKKRLRDADGIIIDEVSMLSGPTLDAAEKICQKVRDIRAPWGGLRVIAVGDFAQLPPVQQNSTFRAWAFLDPVWRRSEFVNCVLKQNMRTGDSEFLQILNYVRKGLVNDQVELFLNRKKQEFDDSFLGTRLFARRNQTDAYNLSELNQLPGKLETYQTIYSGNEKSIEVLKKNSPLNDQLELKKNALVMLRQNDPKLRWVNGSTGYVRQLGKEEIEIELLNGRIITVEQMSFSLLNAEGLPVATATNFPLSLAYAATIHKAQGMTLDRLQVNLNALWEPGQAYVALSRVTDPQNLSVQAWQPQSIKSDPIVSRFYQEIDFI